jgi:transcriptional regulator with XRE-family HTH domain
MTTQTTTKEARSARPARSDLPDVFENVRYLRREIKLSEGDLAEGTGASTRTVRRWAKAQTAARQDTRYERQIDDLRMIVSELEDSLTAKGIRQWLLARNRYLKGDRPIDLLRDGHFKRVQEAAAAFREGYYQ